MKRIRLSKGRSETKALALSRTPRLKLFGDALLLDGEDVAAYDELRAQMRACVQPADIIESMFLDDLAHLEWEVLRWRRLKTSLMRAPGLEALERFLAGELEYEDYSESFEACLAKILQDNLPDDQSDSAQALAHDCARDGEDAVNKVNEVLDRNNISMDRVHEPAQFKRAKELVQEYSRREPDAVALVDKVVNSKGTSMDALLAGVLPDMLDDIERIERLAAIAESRRNNSLREIERHRAVLGHGLRGSVQEIEEGEFEEVIKTPSKRKDAA